MEPRLKTAPDAAFQPVPFLAAYAATKAFVLSLTESLATELEGTGVHVQALCPGNIPTGFQQVAGTEHAPFTRTPSMSADAVAAASLRALERGQVIVIPGIRSTGSRFLFIYLRYRVCITLVNPIPAGAIHHAVS